MDRIFSKKKATRWRTYLLFPFPFLVTSIPVLVPFLTDTQKYENIWDGENEIRIHP